ILLSQSGHTAGRRAAAGPSEVRQEEFTHVEDDVGRFRVHLYRQMGSLALVLRVIPSRIPSFADLRLPVAVKPIAESPRGLVLVPGATGMGKSTTVASMLAYITQTSCRHVLTIEDPIEFVIPAGRGSVSQRELGRDVESFHEALVGAL